MNTADEVEALLTKSKERAKAIGVRVIPQSWGLAESPFGILHADSSCCILSTALIGKRCFLDDYDHMAAYVLNITVHQVRLIRRGFDGERQLPHQSDSDPESDLMFFNIGRKFRGLWSEEARDRLFKIAQSL